MQRSSLLFQILAFFAALSVLCLIGMPEIQDSDRDDISDEQELLDGSNPFDAGSNVPLLETTLCTEWNGFLSMLNVLEVVNLGARNISAKLNLQTSSGELLSSRTIKIAPGAQADTLVHSMAGFQENNVGRICLSHNGNLGDLDGRMSFYKPANDGAYQFAFSTALANPVAGKQYVSFNTFNPSYNPEDVSNPVANWIQISNFETNTQRGLLTYYRSNGSVLGRDQVLLPPQSRRDFAAHRFGASLVGSVEWKPSNSLAKFQVRNVRYIYDNSVGENSFATAFQLEANKGSGEPLSLPLDTGDSSAIVEVSNTLNSKVRVSLNLYNATGQKLFSSRFTLAPHASRHIIADSYLQSGEGIAVVDGGRSNSLIATAMHYGRSKSGSMRFMYGIRGAQTLGTVLRGSYNTFLGQGCQLLLVNPSKEIQGAHFTMTRADGTKIIADGFHTFGKIAAPSGEPLFVPPHGILSYDLCQHDSENNYGVVLVNLDSPNTLYGTILRRSGNNTYRFPTTLRQ